MNVSLTPELEKFIEAQVASGMYFTASEVVRDALRLLQEHEETRQAKLEKLKKAVQVGLDQLKRGETVPAEQVFKKLREKIRQRRGNAA